ncbi:glutamate--tRNA ligase [Candidatus Woesebacteria bacterium]|nr:glutamate--tRNA ligase [Candidatus Woesebacteria bacterium]
MIRVRIAPSPTGFAHVGTAYTALFNYAFAKNKKNEGKFILRLEDTDVKRNVKGAEEAIYEGLSWLGLSWDEGPDKDKGEYGPYRQSERLKTYREWAERLLKEKKAYEDEGAIRFKNTGKDMVWDDLIRGKISFPGGEVTDFVILKSDGYPTYNFGAVIDDILMEITHVIRGEEHISNTPRQLALYTAFAKAHPKFAHLPTLRNKDRKKLSKRRDPVDLRVFREKGYLPEALVNFLCLLGWSHPQGKEIFDLEEFVRLFDFKRVRSAGPIFDTTKLDWINGEYIRKTNNDSLAKLVWEYAERKYPLEKVEEIIPLVRERMNKLSEFFTLAGFLVEEKPPKPLFLTDSYSANISGATISKLNNLPESRWNKQNLDKVLGEANRMAGTATGDFFMDIRGTIAGSSVTPPITESIEILGKKETIDRLKTGQKKFSK